MDYSDNVARILSRPSLREMHKLVSEFGYSGDNLNRTWSMIVVMKETIDFVESHGWTLDEYATACKSCDPDLAVGNHERGMIKFFTQHFNIHYFPKGVYLCHTPTT